MKTFKITYFLHPMPNITITVTAGTEEEAVVFAKAYRYDAFKIEEV